MIEDAKWMCSCGSAAFGESQFVNQQRREHDAWEKDLSEHWLITIEEWASLPCAHCQCLDEPSDDPECVCCKCGERYRPMTEIGGRRYFVDEIPDFVKARDAQA